MSIFRGPTQVPEYGVHRCNKELEITALAKRVQTTVLRASLHLRRHLRPFAAVLLGGNFLDTRSEYIPAQPACNDDPCATPGVAAVIEDRHGRGITSARHDHHDLSPRAVRAMRRYPPPTRHRSDYGRLVDSLCSVGRTQLSPFALNFLDRLYRRYSPSPSRFSLRVAVKILNLVETEKNKALGGGPPCSWYVLDTRDKQNLHSKW